MKNNRTFSIVVVLSYLVGVTLGLFLVSVATWADLESTFYGFFHRTNTRFDGLTCPILMTPNETGSFSVTVTNTTDRALSPAIKTDISARGTFFSNLESLSLEPGESEQMAWDVGPENIDVDRFIFAQVYVYSFYPIPDSENTCGIFIVNLPGNGTVIAWAMAGLSLLGMGFGLYGLKNFPGLTHRGAGNIWNSMMFLSLVIAIGLFVSFMGWWVQGGFILIVAVLLVVIMLGQFLMHPRADH